jgi:hypothetical protein
MNTVKKQTGLPIKWLSHYLHGGQYVYLWFDIGMDVDWPTIFPVFTQPTARIFLRLLTGWVLCTGRRTITGIIPFASRWSIEDTFKNTKQFLGAEQPQSWKNQGPERAAVLGLALYSLVWTWYLRHGYRKTSVAATPWYPGKTTPSFQDALAALRRVLWHYRIISMFGKQAVHYKISKFLIAALEKAA